jgi:hypothetical protein
MRRLGSIILLAAATIGVLALPTAAILFIEWKPDTWLNDLAQYQSLAGGLATLFAAGLATIGVWINVLAQRQNVTEQIEAQQGAITQQIQSNADRAREDWLEQRKEAAYLRHLEMQHLAAAFVGEISIILAHLKNVRDSAEIIKVSGPKAEEEKLTLIAVFRGAHLILYEKNADKIGVFPGDVITELTRLYSVFAAIGELFKSSHSEGWSADKAVHTFLEEIEGLSAEIEPVENLLKSLEQISSASFDATPYLPKRPASQ